MGQAYCVSDSMFMGKIDGFENQLSNYSCVQNVDPEENMRICFTSADLFLIINYLTFQLFKIIVIATRNQSVKNMYLQLCFILLTFILVKGIAEAAIPDYSEYIYVNIRPNTIPSMSSTTVVTASDVNNNLSSCSEGEEDQHNLHQRRSVTPPDSTEYVHGESHECWYFPRGYTPTSHSWSRPRWHMQMTMQVNTRHWFHGDQTADATHVKMPYTQTCNINSTSGIGSASGSDHFPSLHLNDSNYGSLPLQNRGSIRVTLEVEGTTLQRSFEVMAGERLENVINTVYEKADHVLREDLHISRYVPYDLMQQVGNRNTTGETRFTERSVNELSTSDRLQRVYADCVFVIRIRGATGGVQS